MAHKSHANERMAPVSRDQINGFALLSFLALFVALNPLRCFSYNLSSGSSDVALCITGQARDLHITGPSTLRHVLSNWENKVDLFLSLVFDERSFKIVTFEDYPRLKGVSLGQTIAIDEKLYKFPKEEFSKGYHLTMKRQNIPLQNHLQQLDNLAGCQSLLEAHRQVTNWTYKWVMRQRADAFWLKPPPHLSSLDNSVYTVPKWNKWKGINDRLGIGNYRNSLEAFNRLHMANELFKSGYKYVTAENMLMHHLKHQNVTVAFADFNFCLVSRKRKRFYLKSSAVFSLDSGGPLNGAYCRPCNPKAVGKKALKYLSTLRQPGSYPGPISNPRLCDATKLWSENWPEIYDKQTPEEYGLSRRKTSSINFEECTSSLFKMESKTKIWIAPPAFVICKRQSVGHYSLIGQGQHIFPTLTGILHKKSTILSFGLSESINLAWESELQMKVKGIQITLLAGALLNSNTSEIRVKEIDNWYLYRLRRPSKMGKWSMATGAVVEVVKSCFVSGRNSRRFFRGTLVQYLMVLRKWKRRVDLLKISVGQLGVATLISWSLTESRIPICQLLVHFPDSDLEDGFHNKLYTISSLNFTLIRCGRSSIDNSFQCAFMSNLCDFSLARQHTY